ncbi:MAG: hypothetical protein ACOC05_05570 [Oceanicaulis sp.]
MTRDTAMSYGIAFGLLGGGLLASIVFALTGDVALSFGLLPGIGMMVGLAASLFIAPETKTPPDGSGGASKSSGGKSR